jgi:hypothetical protein
MSTPTASIEYPAYTESEYDAYYAEIAYEISCYERDIVRAKKERAAYVAQAAWSEDDCAMVDHLDAVIKEAEFHIKTLVAALDD